MKKINFDIGLVPSHIGIQGKEAPNELPARTAFILQITQGQIISKRTQKIWNKNSCLRSKKTTQSYRQTPSTINFIMRKSTIGQIIGKT